MGCPKGEEGEKKGKRGCFLHFGGWGRGEGDLFSHMGGRAINDCGKKRGRRSFLSERGERGGGRRIKRVGWGREGGGGEQSVKCGKNGRLGVLQWQGGKKEDEHLPVFAEKKKKTSAPSPGGEETKRTEGKKRKIPPGILFSYSRRLGGRKGGEGERKSPATVPIRLGGEKDNGSKGGERRRENTLPLIEK